MAGNAGGGGTSPESMSRALTRGPCVMRVKRGKITVSTRVDHKLGFRLSDLVAVVGSGQYSNLGGRCHPTHP